MIYMSYSVCVLGVTKFHLRDEMVGAVQCSSLDK